IRPRERPLGHPLPAIDGRAANDGYFVPEQIWDRRDIACFALGRPTGSASPLDWAEGQYLRLAQSIDAGYNLDTPSVVKAKYRDAGPILGSGGKCMDVTGGGTANGTQVQLWDCNGTGSQQWSWRQQSRIVNPQSGRCLD